MIILAQPVAYLMSMANENGIITTTTMTLVSVGIIGLFLRPI